MTRTSRLPSTVSLRFTGRALRSDVDPICIYSYQTATKCCRNLRFGLSFVRFDFASHKPVRALGTPLGLACSLSLLPGSFESFSLRDDASYLIMLQWLPQMFHPQPKPSFIVYKAVNIAISGCKRDIVLVCGINHVQVIHIQSSRSYLMPPDSNHPYPKFTTA